MGMHDVKWLLMLDCDLLKLSYWFSPLLPDDADASNVVQVKNEVDVDMVNHNAKADATR